MEQETLRIMSAIGALATKKSWLLSNATLRLDHGQRNDGSVLRVERSTS